MLFFEKAKEVAQAPNLEKEKHFFIPLIFFKSGDAVYVIPGSFDGHTVNGCFIANVYGTDIQKGDREGVIANRHVL